MRRSRVLASRLRESFLVTTKAGASFRGVLFTFDDKALVMRDAEAVGAGENNTNLPLDGEIVVLMADVAYMQRV